jgi:hypothetical protein
MSDMAEKREGFKLIAMVPGKVKFIQHQGQIIHVSPESEPFIVRTDGIEPIRINTVKTNESLND